MYDMRDYIVAMQTLGCSVNWEHGLDAAIELHPETGCMVISDVFASHICNLSNWSVSRKFGEVFPELRGFHHIVEQDTIHPSEVDVECFLGHHDVEYSSSDSAVN